MNVTLSHNSEYCPTYACSTPHTNTQPSPNFTSQKDQAHVTSAIVKFELNRLSDSPSLDVISRISKAGHGCTSGKRRQTTNTHTHQWSVSDALSWFPVLGSWNYSFKGSQTGLVHDPFSSCVTFWQLCFCCRFLYRFRTTLSGPSVNN